MKLKIDPVRWEVIPEGEHPTGVFVHAEDPNGDVHSVDIYFLDKPSLIELLAWNGNNRWAEDVVGILLGHGALHDPTANPANEALVVLPMRVLGELGLFTKLKQMGYDVEGKG